MQEGGFELPRAAPLKPKSELNPFRPITEAPDYREVFLFSGASPFSSCWLELAGFWTSRAQNVHSQMERSITRGGSGETGSPPIPCGLSIEFFLKFPPKNADIIMWITTGNR